TSAGPLFVRKTVSDGSGLEDRLELFDLLFVKLGYPAGLTLTFETVTPLRFNDGLPLIHGGA
ncbi:MAG: hypothetical protein FWC50_10765, partial [Planctomycetaceae bacterium]|nr:hypothetical protein [Planctomycetaceae bacterium]